MKRFIAFFLILLVFFNASVSVFAFVDISSQNLIAKGELTTNNINIVKGVSQEQLKTLMGKTGITRDGIDYLAKLKGTSYSELMTDLQNKKIDAKGLLEILTKGGLDDEQLERFLEENKFNEEGKTYLQIIGAAQVMDEEEEELQMLPNPLSTYSLDFTAFDKKPLTDIQLNTIGMDGFVSSLGNGDYKINFKDITEDNAGRIIKIWEGKDNFPNKLVLENGINLKLNEMDLDQMFVRTNEITTTAQELKADGVDLGEVVVLDPRIELFPDRLRISKTTQFNFKSQAQLGVIRENFAIDSELETEFNKMNQKTGTYDMKVQDLKLNKYNIEPVDNSIVNKLYEVPDKFVNEDDLIDNQKAAVDLDISEAELDEGAIQGLIDECINDFGPNDDRCKESYMRDLLENGDKTFETTEDIEISLILPEINADGLGITTKAEDVRITRAEILSIYEDYSNLMLIAEEFYEDDSGVIEAPELDSNPYEDPDFCQQSSDPEACEELRAEKDERNPSRKVQKLLNGFTLGEHRSYVFSDRLRVGCCGFRKTLYSVRVEFYYAYGFGLRIPIETEVITTPAILDNYNEDNATYDVRYKVRTVDGDVAHYREAGLPENKMFEAQEFVFEFTAGIKYDIRVIGDFIDEHGEIELVSLLARFFKDELQELFGLSDAQIQDVISNNGVDKSKNFVPPFEGSQTYELFKGSVTVPVRDFGIAKLLAKLGASVNLKGHITAECEEVNTNGGCKDGKITFNNTNFQQDTGVAFYNPDDQVQDALGVYNKFGVKLDEFMYIPVLIFRIFAAGGVKVKIPARGRETFWTPEITVYEFEFPLDDLALGAHEDTEGTVDATGGNKLYVTSPDVNVETPHIIVEGDDSRANLYFYDNSDGAVFNQYTVNTAYNPNCTEGRGERWDARTPVWKTPYNDVVYNKDFNIKARGCSIYGYQTEVVTKDVTLTNHAFDISVRYPFSGYSIDSNERMLLDNDFIGNGNLRGKYMFNSTDLYGPSPCSKGENYDKINGISFRDIAKSTLENDFEVEVSAIACNGSNQTLNGKGLQRTVNSGGYVQTRGVVYTVHNNEFNPSININGGEANITGYRYPEAGYTNFYSYTLNGNDPSCEGSPMVHNRVTNEGDGQDLKLGVYGANDLYMNTPNNQIGLSKIYIVPGMTIKARACVLNPQGQLVFSSDIKSASTDHLGVGMEFEGDLADRIRDKLDPDEVMDLVDGFMDPATDPVFMESIMNGLDQGLFTKDGLVAMARLMSSGGLNESGMRTLSHTMSGTKAQVRTGFQTMITTRTITMSGVSTLSSLMSSGSITKQGLIYLSENFDAAVTRSMNKAPEGEYKSGDNAAYVSPKTPENYTSDDEYVNDKLDEIDDCFVELYEFHLKNIDDTIADFEKKRDSAKDEAERKKYERALKKLEEIRKIYVQKYSGLDFEQVADSSVFYVIELNKTGSYDRFISIKEDFENHGYAVFADVYVDEQGEAYYQIIVGPYNTQSQANEVLESMQRNYPDNIYVQEGEITTYDGNFSRQD